MNIETTELVERIAKKVMKSHPEVDKDDLIQTGLLTYLEAQESFECDRGIPFEGFVIKRIEGSMRNSIASFSEEKSMNAFLIRNKKEHIKNATESGVSLFEALKELTLDLFHSKILTMNEASQIEYVGFSQQSDLEIIKSRIQTRLNEKCNEMERMVVILHYEDHYSFKDIAELLGLSKSRISQVHRSAMEKLKLSFR